MKSDKALTTDTAVRVLHSNPSIADRTYDAEVGMLIGMTGISIRRRSK